MDNSSKILKLKNKKSKIFKKRFKIDELVDDSGAMISGDETKNTTVVNNGWNNPQTSDDFSRKTAQGPRYYYSPTYGNKYYRENSIKNKPNLSEELGNISEEKMRKMIEDIVKTRSSYDSTYDDFDFVNRFNDNDISNTKQIPGFESLKSEYEKPILARKLLYLGDLMKKESVNGEEVAIILNHILDISSDIEIPNDYKKILISKINNGKLKNER